MPKKYEFGGAATINIQKSDCRIINLYHEKISGIIRLFVFNITNQRVKKEIDGWDYGFGIIKAWTKEERREAINNDIEKT